MVYWRHCDRWLHTLNDSLWDWVSSMLLLALRSPQDRRLHRRLLWYQGNRGPSPTLENLTVLWRWDRRRVDQAGLFVEPLPPTVTQITKLEVWHEVQGRRREWQQLWKVFIYRFQHEIAMQCWKHYGSRSWRAVFRYWCSPCTDVLIRLWLQRHLEFQTLANVELTAQ